MFKNKLGTDVMSERELKQFIKNMEKYVAEKKNTITKEEARESLIRTGVLSKDGKTLSKHQRFEA